MKKVKDKKVLVGSDRAGYALKEAVIRQLRFEGWEVTDVGVQDPLDPNHEMFHRVGFKVGSMVSEGEFERALVFCGTGQGIHLAANKCPHVHCAMVESEPAALRAITGNNCNILSMGSWFIPPAMGIACAKAFLEHDFAEGFEFWPLFKEYHQLAYDEIENFNYEEYKANGFELKNKPQVPMGFNPRMAPIKPVK